MTYAWRVLMFSINFFGSEYLKFRCKSLSLSVSNQFLWRYIVFALALLTLEQAQATHNRAGEITYRQIGDLTIEVTITTYTRTRGTDVDRDSLQLFWGDGTSSWLPRNNGNLNKGELLPNDVKKNIYQGRHTYPGRSTYTMSTQDPNRIAGILNVDYPNSVNIPFFIETTFTFLSAQFQGTNSSAILLQPPIDFACQGERFVHNPNAYDPDGDSLSYELVVPLQASNMPVPNYLYPQQIQPGPGNRISLDPRTGDFVWNAPQRLGEYNVAIKIYEYRRGILINTLIRDMQIFVQDCNRTPPEIMTMTEWCVVAGDTLKIPFTIKDADAGQRVRVAIFGGPVEQNFSPAYVEQEGIYLPAPRTGTIIWPTVCEHISAQPYTLVIRAEDNTQDSLGLSILESIRIKVVAPPPLVVLSEKNPEGILVTWQQPYRCEVTANDYFRGFSVWRRVNPNPFNIDTCTPGLPQGAYVQIAYDVTDQQNGRYYFQDREVERGLTYCYRILAEYAYLSANGNPYNRISGLPSEESCSQLNRDIPFILNATVDRTDRTNGQITLRWTRPLAQDLDTVNNPGPYTFAVERANGLRGTDFTELAGSRRTFSNFSAINDTIFLDQGINTVTQGYTYRLVMDIRGNQKFGQSIPASSVFLTIVASDRKNILSWDHQVPWKNYQYVIYRENPATQQLDSLSLTTLTSYEDGDLDNTQTYCYTIKAFGTYGISDLPAPLINWSNQACGTPVDTVAPCAPELTVANICNQATPGTPVDQFSNTLTWFVPSLGCDREADYVGYKIYYAPSVNDSLQLIATIDNPSVLTYEHRPDLGITGCYAVTAFDGMANESSFSKVSCVNNCPSFELPNAFTPNGDGTNDRFIPRTLRFIERIEMNIFNRWGQLVFTTTDPMINWDGTNLNGKLLAAGVYYYTCRVYNRTSTGIDPLGDVLQGYIHLIRE